MHYVQAQEDHQQLREFAVAMAIGFPAIFMVLLPWLFDYTIPLWPLAVTGVMLCLRWLKPGWLLHPYRIWMCIAAVLGWINTRIILAMAFYLMITPMGLIMKGLGKLQYKKQGAGKGKSAWITRTDNPDKHNLENPF